MDTSHGFTGVYPGTGPSQFKHDDDPSLLARPLAQALEYGFSAKRLLCMRNRLQYSPSVTFARTFEHAPQRERAIALVEIEFFCDTARQQATPLHTQYDEDLMFRINNRAAAPSQYNRPAFAERAVALVSTLRAGRNLGSDTPQNHAHVGMTLEHIFAHPDAALFDAAWDTLYSAASRPEAFAFYRPIVEAFLKAGEPRRLQNARAVAEHSDDPEALLYAWGLIRALSLKTLNEEQLSPARDIMAKLTSRLVAGSQVHLYGQSPYTALFATGHKRKFYANVNNRLSRTLMRTVQATGDGARCYTLSETWTTGSVGGIRVAMDDAGKLFAVKVQRLEDFGVSDHKTGISIDTDIARETEAMRAAGLALAPVEVITVDEKVYSFAPLAGPDMLKVRAAFYGSAMYPAIVRKMFSSIMTDLEKIHQAGLIHRDVRLDNIMDDCHGGMTLADLGLHCSRAQDRSDPEYPPGTPGYLAPEVVIVDAARAKSYTQQADVFSAGLCAWYMHLRDSSAVPFAEDEDEDAASHNSMMTAMSEAFAGNMREARATYNIWRAARCHPGDPGGDINWARVARGATPLDAAAMEFSRNNDVLANLVLNKILLVNPDRRLDASAAKAMAATLASADANEADGIAHAMRALQESDSKLTAAIHALQRNYEMQHNVWPG